MTLRQLRPFLVLLPLVFSGSTASAATLQYVGKQFFFGEIFDGHVEASVTFSSPVTTDAVLTLADISSFSISSLSPSFGDRTIVSEDATFAFAEFAIGPDGLPTDWGLGAELDIEAGDNPEQIAIHAGTTHSIFNRPRTFDTDAFVVDDREIKNATGFGLPFGATASAHGRGIWKLVPEPGSLALLAFSFLAFPTRSRLR